MSLAAAAHFLTARRQQPLPYLSRPFAPPICQAPSLTRRPCTRSSRPHREGPCSTPPPRGPTRTQSRRTSCRQPRTGPCSPRTRRSAQRQSAWGCASASTRSPGGRRATSGRSCLVDWLVCLVVVEEGGGREGLTRGCARGRQPAPAPAAPRARPPRRPFDRCRPLAPPQKERASRRRRVQRREHGARRGALALAAVDRARRKRGLLVGAGAGALMAARRHAAALCAVRVFRSARPVLRCWDRALAVTPSQSSGVYGLIGKRRGALGAKEAT